MKKIIVVPFVACVLFTNIVCTKSIEKDSVGSVAETERSDPAVAVKTNIYVIKKGAHYCTPNPLTFTSKTKLTFTAVFDSSCIYQTIDPKNQNDINKLYGFSDCNSQHLENSARVGWRWSDDSLRIFGFVHNDGNMIFQEITTAQIDSVISCRITCLADQYQFDVDGKTIFLPRHCSGKYTRYRLYPYFGGDEVAPHDIPIKITELKN